VKAVGKLLPEAYNPETIPEVGELDELETFVGSKKNKIWLWTAVDHFKPGILGWVLGDHSAETFRPLWKLVFQNLHLRESPMPTTSTQEETIDDHNILLWLEIRLTFWI
jgi:hypothetical protein